jgi:hypothetical protein
MMELERQPVQSQNQSKKDEVSRIAEETLKDLLPFTHHIELAAELAAKELSHPDPAPFLQLIDHLAVFSEAVLAVKETLQLAGPAKSNQLEEELLILTRALLKSKEERNLEMMEPLLSLEIPRHFKAWRERGIPALQAYRDT